MTRPRLLLIDDGDTYAGVIDAQMPEFELVRPQGEEGSPCLRDGPEALEFLERGVKIVDAILLDMHFDVPDDRLLPLAEDASRRRTRRFQGVAILREIRRRHPDVPVVLLTEIEDLSLVDHTGELASQSMTYLLDGDDIDALRVRVNAALEEASLELEESRVLWGADSSMRDVRRRLTVLARGGMPVILEGETGTGKSFLAEQFVHANSGRSGPFVVVDLSALPRDLIPAHMFGAVRGAYTGAVADRKGVFELAHRGTVLLDEVQNVPLEVQKQLLLVLQDGRVRPLGSTREVTVDVKVIAASNRPLDEAVSAGRFRPDLYMRLSPATRVRIPPLRERPGDLRFLARRFAEQAADNADISELRDEVAQALGMESKAPVRLTIGRRRAQREPGALELALPGPAWKMLEAHRWPGNVRELEMVMHNAVTFTLVAAVDAIRSGLRLESRRLQVDPGLVGELLSGSAALESGGEQAGDSPPGGIAVRIEPGSSLNQVANSLERQCLLELFKRTDGDFEKMAEMLLSEPGKARAVRLRFNQLGLRVREIARR
ncbi:MAG: sigma 54-interacting transcriptional regulator [Polyangia bacterium]